MSEHSTTRKPTILIVDDDEILVELLSDELTPHFIVEWARNGSIALKSVARQTPDVIFLDQGLPDTQGVHLIDEIRKRNCDSPVVMLTASEDVRVAAAAMRAGAVDFIVKDLNEYFYENIVPTAIRAVDKWNNDKELEYLREQQEEQARRTNEFNRQLRTNNEKLERAHELIEASHQQLRKKNRRLSELYETAHRFVDNVSHEMRTPLTVIKEFLSITLDGLAGELNEQQQEYLGIAMSKTNDLAQMVDDMLDISKIEAGLLRTDRTRSTVEDILSRVRDTLARKADSNNVRLEYDVQPDLPQIYCDREKSGRALINLVVNAIKFSPENSTIQVWARMSEQPGEVRIGVTDDGPGIAQENLEVIFQRFKQVGETARSSTKGFGLGLNIVKELANLNLGDVEVESELGKGSTFSYTLPIYDHRTLLNRFLDRLHTIDQHGEHLVFIRASSLNPAPDICCHIKSFVAHHVSAFDLSFARPSLNDVILVAVTADPQGLCKRLEANNREELRTSPGSTVDLRFETLNNWNIADDRTEITECFAGLFSRETIEQVHGTRENPHN